MWIFFVRLGIVPLFSFSGSFDNIFFLQWEGEWVRLRDLFFEFDWDNYLGGLVWSAI